MPVWNFVRTPKAIPGQTRPDFRRRVPEPAVAEVNHLTGVVVMWEPVRKGRKARRENTVESIEAEALALRRQLAADLEATWPKDLLDDDEIEY